ncbi:MAG TPA: glycosyltransferase [Verrucomicrobiae bacterium]|nr:glycosyltransferase [Verrucomicrobiae bacterium]
MNNECITTQAVQMPRAGPPPVPLTNRPITSGKFLFVGGQKLLVRGATYGPFQPEPDGCEYHTPREVMADFSLMREHGFNAVRTYTVPPRWLLDLAQGCSLRVLVGLPWEQHVTFLSSRKQMADIQRRVEAGVCQCAAHPAVLGYAIGNEIPAAVVRWYGHHRIEQYLRRLAEAARNRDPAGLLTYVNYPSTEYLELPFLDFVSFNVYLESEPKLAAYLARLQNSAGDRPLVMGELGLDSLRNGESGQAQTLAWQTQLTFEAGCAGLFLFSWTDEWYRGGEEIRDWRFGLTSRSRAPKPALAQAARVFSRAPFARERSWPSASVVVCSYNGGQTLANCLEGIRRLDYPSFETIVVDDGSTDNVPAIAERFGVRLLRTPNGGLSRARNIGWRAAQGELIAYLDDDASPDPHWLRYLASTFLEGDFAGVGGPNIAWPGDGFVAQCVDQSPGNPTHVLLTEREAEHLPGCNMAFRKACLAAVGGFDAQFRIAGDDVDLCWRLQQQGWRLGFHPAAMVWHHRRGTVRGYWRQQFNYGKAEAMLEKKWPEKYNAVGHTTWSGRLYAKTLLGASGWSQRRIYHGTWGTALFQSVYDARPGMLASILMLPEWYLVIGALALLSLSGFFYAPLRYLAALLVLAFIPPLLHAAISGIRAVSRNPHAGPLRKASLALGTASLHFLQPAARLLGRLVFGLTPWRSRGARRPMLPLPNSFTLWSEGHWQSAEQRLKLLEYSLRGNGAAVVRGGDYDRWDLEVRGGLLGSARLLMVVEEHGQGRQFVRLRLWPMGKPAVLVLAALCSSLAMIAALHLEWASWALLNLPAILLVGRTLYEAGSAMAALRRAMPIQQRPSSPVDTQILSVESRAKDAANVSPSILSEASL